MVVVHNEVDRPVVNNIEVVAHITLGDDVGPGGNCMLLKCIDQRLQLVRRKVVKHKIAAEGLANEQPILGRLGMDGRDKVWINLHWSSTDILIAGLPSWLGSRRRGLVCLLLVAASFILSSISSDVFIVGRP